jgi:phthiodiolone/phenolphthiodiolone dimycocerosates ketoreductase
MKFGTYAYGDVPLDAQVAAAAQAEREGWDFFIYWDQANGWTPKAIYTPDITPLANQVPSLDVFYDAPVAIAQAALQTERMEFMNAVVDVVRRPPYVQALTMLTLDHATKGRNITILASGEIKQLRAYGFKRVGSADKLWDTVHIVRRFCESPDPVTFEGRQYSVDRAMLALQPYGDRLPPLWVAGASDEIYHLAGAVADGWTTYGPPGVQDDPEVLRREVAKVHEQARIAGKDPQDVAICFQIMTMLHDDAKVVDALRDHPHVRWMSQMVLPTSNLYRQWGLGPHPMGDDWSYAAKMDRHYAMSRAEVLDICDRTPREAADRVFFTGSPARVAERLRPYLECGVTHLLIMNVTPLAGEADLRPQLMEEIKALAPVSSSVKGGATR